MILDQIISKMFLILILKTVILLNVLSSMVDFVFEMKLCVLWDALMQSTSLFIVLVNNLRRGVTKISAKTSIVIQ